MLNDPKKVILHCSDSPDYLLKDERFDSVGVSEIDFWHRERGWNCIGYHLVVRQSGLIETGRNIKEIGAHVRGHNTNSIGICWIGRQFPQPCQVDSLLKLYVSIKNRYNIEYGSWFGHYEFNRNKTCPGFSMDIFRRLLKETYKTELAKCITI